MPCLSNLNYVGVCHFEEVENKQTKGTIEDTLIFLKSFIEMFCDTAHYNHPQGAAKNTQCWLKNLRCRVLQLSFHFAVKHFHQWQTS